MKQLLRPLFSLLLLLLLSAPQLHAETSDKVQYKFGGRLDLKVMYDTYKSKDARDLLYFYPLEPNLNSAGQDLNEVGQLRFSPYATRLNFGVSNIQVGEATARIFVEADFFGSSEAYLQQFRLRHAYVRFDWERTSLLAGQTNNLNFLDEILSPAVDYGGGFPYYILNRGMQVRVDHRMGRSWTLRAAAEMFWAHKPVGPTEAQVYSQLPALDAQLVYAPSDRFMAGVTAGVKFLRPRTVDASDRPISKTVTSYSLNAFFKAVSEDDHRFQFWGIYGSNLTHLNLLGGYGKLESCPTTGDYGYGNLYTFSAWFDYDVPISEQWRAGVLFGYQENLGSKQALDITTDAAGNYLYGYYTDPNLLWFGRVAPRISFHPIPRMVIAAEYSYNPAQWGRSTDNYLQPTDLYDVVADNRVVLSFMYAF